MVARFKPFCIIIGIFGLTNSRNMATNTDYTTRITCCLTDEQIEELLELLSDLDLTFLYSRVYGSSGMPVYRFWMKHFDGEGLNILLIAIQEIGSLGLVSNYYNMILIHLSTSCFNYNVLIN